MWRCIANIVRKAVIPTAQHAASRQRLSRTVKLLTVQIMGNANSRTRQARTMMQTEGQ